MPPKKLSGFQRKVKSAMRAASYRGAGEVKHLPVSSGVAGILSAKQAEERTQRAVRSYLALTHEEKCEKKKDGRDEESSKPPTPPAKDPLLLLTRSLLSTGGPMRVYLGNSASMVTTGSGSVNLNTSNSSLSSLGEWGSWAALFDEFFVLAIEIEFVPTSMFQYGIGYAAGTNLTSVPITVTSLHHGVSAYSSMATAMENATTKVRNTATPWRYTWKNVESPRSGIVISPELSGAVATQGWCLTAATPAALYTGFVQYLGSDILGPASSTQFGRVLIRYEVLFRLRA